MSARKSAQSQGMTRAQLLALPVAVGLNDANRALGIGRTVGFDLARRGVYPVEVLRMGHVYRVRRADLLRLLGVQEPEVAE